MTFRSYKVRQSVCCLSVVRVKSYSRMIRGIRASQSFQIWSWGIICAVTVQRKTGQAQMNGGEGLTNLGWPGLGDHFVNSSPVPLVT